MSLDIWLTIEVETGNKPYRATLFDGNYTSNVIPMWDLAGVYDALYDSAGKRAGSLVDTLKSGVFHMRANKADYVKLNPQNGWGNYKTALRFLIRFARACRDYPLAEVGVWK